MPVMGGDMSDDLNRERVVHGLSEVAYHATPALSATGAWTLGNDCPAVYWHSSPFNPDAAAPENGKPMQIGTALHLAVLEPERMLDRIVVVPAEDWRTKAAKEARDEAYDAGLTPLLTKDLALVGRLAAALRADEFVAKLLHRADTEVSYFWTANEIPCKARADIVTHGGRVMADLKASASASPLFFRRQAFNAGHFLRDPWYRDGWECTTGERITDYWYVIVAREPPHLVTVAKLDERAVEWGRLMIRRAMDLFKRCRDSGVWPPYCDGPVSLSLPEWAEYQLADREQAGEFRATITSAEVSAGFDFLAP